MGFGVADRRDQIESDRGQSHGTVVQRRVGLREEDLQGRRRDAFLPRLLVTVRESFSGQRHNVFSVRNAFGRLQRQIRKARRRESRRTTEMDVRETKS